MNYVMCLKWGDKYPADYVNVLFSMVKRNLTQPFVFVCFTDNAAGLHPRITAMPLIDSDLKGWWGKISYFKNPLFTLKGTALVLDLDMVIIDNIDCLFNQPGEFCIMKDYWEQNGNNTSIMRFEINQHEDIYNDLDLSNKAFCTGDGKSTVTRVKYWGDQVWVTEKRPNAVNFNKNWFATYKWECLQNNVFRIPNGCKIIVFTGKPNPHEVLHVKHWWR